MSAAAEPLLTVRDVAQQLAISEQGARDLLKRGALCGSKVGPRWRVEPAQLRAYIAASRQTAPRPGPHRAPSSVWGDLDPIENEFM